jgi:CxxC-x17-CxxC domain-containing protein
MPLFESCLAFLSATSAAASLHSWFSGFRTGERIGSLLEELHALRIDVQTISDGILYVPSLREVTAVSPTSLREPDLHDLRQALEPARAALGQTILSTATLAAPRFAAKLTDDPWSLLYDIRPLERLSSPSNPDLVPLLFEEGGRQYVGWQMQGALPLLLGCKYEAFKTSRTPSAASSSGSITRALHLVTCDACGAPVEVPFDPNDGRPIYCRPCFSDLIDAMHGVPPSE